MTGPGVVGVLPVSANAAFSTDFPFGPSGCQTPVIASRLTLSTPFSSFPAGTVLSFGLITAGGALECGFGEVWDGCAIGSASDATTAATTIDGCMSGP